MASSLFLALKTLFVILTCIMAVALVYLFSMYHFSSCLNPPWWMQVAVYDVCIDLIFIAAWFFYKESSWIKTLVFSFIIFWCGCLVTCAYIAIQFLKLSPEEYSKDPLYFVLARHKKGDVMGYTRRHSIVTAKVIVVALGCYLVGYIIHAFSVDGSPFRKEVLTP